MKKSNDVPRGTKIRTWLNFDADDVDREIPVGESLTVPDQVLSLRELINMSMRGQEVPVHTGVYADEDDNNPYAEVQHLDMSEIAEYREALNKRARLLREQRAQAQEPDEVGKPQKSDSPKPDDRPEDAHDPS